MAEKPTITLRTGDKVQTYSITEIPYISNRLDMDLITVEMYEEYKVLLSFRTRYAEIKSYLLDTKLTRLFEIEQIQENNVKILNRIGEFLPAVG